MNDDNQLSGVRVVVVEDDALMAMDLKATLVEAGAVVVGLCQTLDEAMARVDADDFCVVDRSWVGHGVAGRSPAGPPGRPVHSLHGKLARRTGLA